jgi:hypothetical protein
MLKTLGHFQWSSDYAGAWLFVITLSGLAMIMDLEMERSGGEYVFQNQMPVLRYSAALIAIALVTLFSANGNHAFIYFRF